MADSPRISGRVVPEMLPLLPTVVLFLAAAASIAAAEPRQPNSRWTVNFHDSQCVASRSYGTAESPLDLVIKAPAVGDVLQVGIIRDAELVDTDTLEGKVSLGEGKPLPVTVLAFTATESKKRAWLVNLPAERVPAMTAAPQISFHVPDQLDERLSLSGMAPLMKVMAECVTDLRAIWNIPDEDGRTPKLKRRAVAHLTPVVYAHYYRGVSSARLFGGAVSLALLVDEAGKVADCTVVASSGSASLGTRACPLVLERGGFSPAIGIDGKPAKSGILEHIDWRLSKPRE